MIFTSPKRWIVPFKRKLSIYGYSNQIIMSKHFDGRVVTSNGVNVQISDRNLENPTVLWSATSSYPGFTVAQILVLPSGTMLVYLTKWNGESYILRSTDTTYTAFSSVHNTWNGEMLLRSWSCNLDGVILAGEYPTIEPIEAVTLWKVTNDGRDWVVLKVFNGRQATIPEIYHIHCVQYDVYSDLWWISVGDTDAESKVYSTDGLTLTLIGSGSQHWRAVSFTFDENFVYWCTDGTISGYARQMRYDKRDNTYRIGQAIDGYSFVTQVLNGLSYGHPLFINEAHTRWVNNVAMLSNDGLNWYKAFEWKANPEATPFPAWNGFVDNEDGRMYAFATSLLRHDTGEPFNNGTIIIDVI